MKCPVCGIDYVEPGPLTDPLAADPLAQLLIHMRGTHGLEANAMPPMCCGVQFMKYTQWADHIRKAGHTLEELLVREALAR